MDKYKKEAKQYFAFQWHKLMTVTRGASIVTFFLKTTAKNRIPCHGSRWKRLWQIVRIFVKYITVFPIFI